MATSDFDDAHAALESVFQPVSMHLHESAGPTGRIDMALTALRLGELTVGYLAIGHSGHIRAAQLDHFHVMLPVCGVAASRTGHMDAELITVGQGAVFMPDAPAEAEWSEGYAQFYVMFPRESVRLEMEAMLDRPIGGSIDFSPAMDLTTGRGRSWMSALQLIEHQAGGAQEELRHPLAVANLQKMLIDLLVLGQRHNYTETLASPSVSGVPSAVRQAIDLMRGHPERPWTTASLAREVAVSARSLQEGFQRSTGVPPMRYLRDLRLHRVHDDLLTASPEAVTVSQIARKWGFLYLGRFAATYREKFGQSPSETLRTRGQKPAQLTYNIY